MNRIDVLSKNAWDKYGVNLNVVEYQGDIHLTFLGVAKDKQRRGLGKLIMKQLIEIADYEGKKIYLELPTRKTSDGWVFKSRSFLLKFYKKHGFMEDVNIWRHNRMIRYPILKRR